MPDINTYINQSRQQGLTDAQIKHNLLSAGWKEEQINDVLGISLSSKPVVSTAKKNTIIALIMLGYLLAGTFFSHSFNSFWDILGYHVTDDQ